MISLDEARAILLEDVAPVGVERVALADSFGRTLAASVVAEADQPPNPISAMDGYAVRDADATADTSLRLVGSAPAGRPFQGTVGSGEAVQIATGGVVPDGADRVVIQEIVERDGEHIRLRAAPEAQFFIRERGCDFRKGETLLNPGDHLTAARVGLAAAANVPELQVRLKPRVLVLASGDELREPGSNAQAGTIVNSAAFALEALVVGWGGRAERSPVLSDDLGTCRAQIEQAAIGDFDIIVPLGGASVGERDVLRPVIEALGARTLFERIAVQPGKPCWHARFDRKPLVLGLPGNPVSAFACAHLLLRPLLTRLLGRTDDASTITAALTQAMPRGSARETYWRATVEVDDRGCLRVTPDPKLDSSLQLPLANANALIRRPAAAAPLETGALVEVVRLTSW